MTYLTYQYYYVYGYHVLANYHLKDIPYTYFSTLEDFKKLSNLDGNCISIDELHGSADARRSMSPLIIKLSQKILQSRKMSSLEKPTRLFFTAQLITSVEYRLRSSEICNTLWKPKIIARDGITGRPLVMRVEVFVPDKDKIDEFKFKKTFTVGGLNKDGTIDMSLYNICDAYDTLEEVESITDNTLNLYVEKYAEQVEDFKRLKEIAVFIKRKEPSLSKSFIDDVAMLIKMARTGSIDIGSVDETVEQEVLSDKGIV
jgi:hypothetical protein